jgi:hypothetical protein
MTKKIIAKQASLGQIAWVLPNPSWQSLVVGSKPIVGTYTICNNSKSLVTISTVEFVQNEDSRLQIVGGTCLDGKALRPNETCTVLIEANPRYLGSIKQVLAVSHSGLSSPLWIDIVISVVKTDAIRDGGTYLVDETKSMERRRRLSEQQGHRRFARVNAREHGNESESENISEMSAEGGMQNNILQNPWLNSQRFDGVDPNLNPEPPLNSTARTEFDNERREQEMEKQLRLGNMPRISPAPKPQGF